MFLYQEERHIERNALCAEMCSVAITLNQGTQRRARVGSLSDGKLQGSLILFTFLFCRASVSEYLLNIHASVALFLWKRPNMLDTLSFIEALSRPS